MKIKNVPKSRYRRKEYTGGGGLVMCRTNDPMESGAPNQSPLLVEGKVYAFKERLDITSNRAIQIERDGVSVGFWAAAFIDVELI